MLHHSQAPRSREGFDLRPLLSSFLSPALSSPVVTPLYFDSSLPPLHFDSSVAVASGDEMMSARHRSSPFTATQWQELEHQALIFKYMLYGIPVPPDLLYSMKRGWDLPITPNLPRFFPPHPTGGWGCFQVGFGRKGADPEPGRCRRTDGKKWRCSKEAFPDSKYCERHMHRGRNRSRKPVESTPTTPPSTNPSSSAFSSPPCAAPTRTEHPFLQPYSSKAIGIPMPMGIPNLDSIAYSSASAVKDYRYMHGLKDNVVDEHAFFSESSGSLKSISDSSLDMSWMSMKRASSVLSSSRHPQQQQEVETDTEPQQPLRLFFDEWPPPKHRASWLDSEVDPSDRASASSTQLSISIPTADSHLPNSR